MKKWLTFGVVVALFGGASLLEFNQRQETVILAAKHHPHHHVKRHRRARRHKRHAQKQFMDN